MTANIFRFFGAILGTFLLLGFCAYALMSLVDFPVSKKPDFHKHQDIAALAIRDSVPSYQQQSTEDFGKSYLSAYYDTLYYFEQHFRDDQKDNFSRQLLEALRQYPRVDIYILAHGNSVYLEWIEVLPDSLTQKIMLVYHSGCKSAKESTRWLALGADAFVAHQGLHSISPIFFLYFTRRFTRGYPLKQSVEEANLLTEKMLGRITYRTKFPLYLPQFDSKAYLFEK